MVPLADMHCHLLAGLDDGPATVDEAVAMCRLAHAGGTRLLAAGAHQNADWPAVTPDAIRAAAAVLAHRLKEEQLAITIFPCAEVMVTPDLVAAWQRGTLLSVADGGKYLLVEYPHGQFVDLRGTARRFAALGVRLILAHPERCPDLLFGAGHVEELIAAGCLMQVSASSVTRPRDGEHEQALRDWFRRGIVHLLGSDGHSTTRRRPTMDTAYRTIAAWAGDFVADQVASVNGMAVSQGLSLRTPLPRKPRSGWLLKWWA